MVVQITQSKRAHLTSHSEIPGFNVFSSPIQNINTLQEQMLCCISHLTANIFNFSWNVELGIFITSVTRTKQMWRLWSSNSWQVLSVHLHSGLNPKDTAQQPGSVRTKTPWIRCVLQEACSWYLHQFKFCLSACKFYGAWTSLSFTEGHIHLEFRHWYDTN